MAKAKAPKAKAKAPKATGTPRNLQVGTTYAASGFLAAPSNQSEMGSSLPVRIPELVPELASQYQRSVTYNQMMNDAGCDVSIRATKTPVMGADFYVEPASSSQQDADIADFICDNLFEGTSHPFLFSLEDILRMCEDGFSVLEKVTELREWSPQGTGRNTKQFTMLKNLAYRPAATILAPEYDNNGYVKTLTQNAIQGDGTVSEKKMPVERLMIFTLNRKGGDITGKSLLRTAYPHWYYKTHLYKVDAIQKERHALGIPHGKLLPGYTKDDKAALNTMLRNLRTNEESFALTTAQVELEFLEVKGNLVDVMKSADHHNMMIMLNVMAVFLALGAADSGGGSRAVGATQSDIFMKSLRYMANIICDQINKFLIPELVVWNFPVRDFPELKVRNIGETQDLQKLASALANLYSQSVVTGDEPTENWVRRVFDMPTKIAIPGQIAQPPTGPPGNATQGGNQNPVDEYGNPAPAPTPTPNNGSSQKGTTTVAARDQGGGNNGKAASGAAV